MRCRSDGRRFALHPGGTCSPCSPQRHLLSLPRGRGPSQTPKFLSPGPPSPWLPALSTRAASQLTRHPWEPLTPAEPATSRVSPSPGNTAAGSVSAARVPPRGCKGRSPLHKITLKSPPSRWEGGRGDGGKNKAQVKGRRATKTATPPPGAGTPPQPRPARGKAPLRAPAWQVL